MVFEKKKIQMETLSEYLIAVRKNLNLTVAEVGQKTAIAPKFIVALEEGKFKLLPAGVYAVGFLRRLAQLYVVDADELICQYKKEQMIDRQLKANTEQSGSFVEKKFWKKLVITPKLLSLSLGLLFVGVSIGYIIWQVWSINKTPVLEIIEPQNNAVIQGTTAMVRGHTDAGNSVAVNEQGIFVDTTGNFQTQLGLSSGPKEIKITASNRFDKQTVKTVSVNVAGQPSNAPESLMLKVDFTAAVSLSYFLDGQAMDMLNFQAGDSKIFFAKQKILLTTSDAGATRVTVNGQSLGAMGRQGERLENVPFTAPPTTATGTNP